jgi:phosphoadenosine phosphosulfate reductase
VPYRATARSTTTQDLEAVARGLEHAAPQEVLEWAMDAYEEGLTLSVSFGGAEGIVLLDMLARITDRVRVFTLDTGFLFPETVKFREELMRRYGLSLEVVRPRLNITQQAARIGERLYALDPDACCRMRKVEPLERALEGCAVWVTGIRRDQTAERRDTPVVGWEERFGVAKVAPLARWSAGQVDEYVRRHDLPLNPLLEKGYRSIGCVPCTRPVEHGEDARAGRWAGTEKTECGLHWMQEGA